MKIFNFKNSIYSYLFDLDYFISFFENKCHIYNYDYINNISSSIIEFILNNKKYLISGNDFIVIKLTKKELLFEGNIKKVELL